VATLGGASDRVPTSPGVRGCRLRQRGPDGRLRGPGAEVPLPPPADRPGEGAGRLPDGEHGLDEGAPRLGGDGRSPAAGWVDAETPGGGVPAADKPGKRGGLRPVLVDRPGLLGLGQARGRGVLGAPGAGDQPRG